jgi:catalase
LFFNSQSEVEQQHIINAFSFELGKVDVAEVRERVLGLLNEVSKELAKEVASNLGMPVPKKKTQLNHGVPADFDPERYEPTKSNPSLDKDPALSMMRNGFGNIATRKVAFLCADGVDDKSVNDMKKALDKEGAMVKILGPNSTEVKTADGKSLKVDEAFRTSASVVFDAFYVPAGEKAHMALKKIPKAIHFLNEGYKHCKPIATAQENGLIEETYFWNKLDKKNLAEDGVIVGKDKSSEFIKAIGQHRFWKREEKDSIPA